MPVSEWCPGCQSHVLVDAPEINHTRHLLLTLLTLGLWFPVWWVISIRGVGRCPRCRRTVSFPRPPVIAAAVVILLTYFGIGPGIRYYPTPATARAKSLDTPPTRSAPDSGSKRPAGRHAPE
jgi:hypothetical protein